MAAVNRVAVVVLGDVGRSPRMQYHCMSLAALPNTEVSLVGFMGEACVPAVRNNAAIRPYLLRADPFRRCSRRLFLLYAPLKVLFQILQLFFTLLFSIPRPRTFLIQNPPSIPTLMVVWMVAKLRRSRIVIDWHNFGYTVLGMNIGDGHPVVRVARVYEKFFARRADAHMCVTRAMQGWLRANWGVEATVLYDMAPSFFHLASVAERHDLFTRLAADFPPPPGSDPGATLFTEPTTATADGVRMRRDRPALLISSTSWTPDEDFSILLDALVQLDTRLEGRSPPHHGVWVVVTGKGPQRAHYEAKIAKLGLAHVTVKTMWLAAEDYPLLLGSSDLGVCLHTSTSGLDLPMKVVDMFGCQLPVCAVGFDCLEELVRHNENGFIFRDSAQLADQLHTLLGSFPTAAKLEQLRGGVRRSREVGWQENWTAHAAPLFQ